MNDEQMALKECKRGDRYCQKIGCDCYKDQARGPGIAEAVDNAMRMSKEREDVNETKKTITLRLVGPVENGVIQDHALYKGNFYREVSIIPEGYEACELADATKVLIGETWLEVHGDVLGCWIIDGSSNTLYLSRFVGLGVLTIRPIPEPEPTADRKISYHEMAKNELSHVQATLSNLAEREIASYEFHCDLAAALHRLSHVVALLVEDGDGA